MKRTIWEKLKSRKLWAAVAGVVVGIAAMLGADENEMTQVAGIVTAAGSIIAYIFGESKVDAATTYIIRKDETAETEYDEDDEEEDLYDAD